MVFEIACTGCGTVLYQGFDLRSAKDLLKVYTGHCKKCGMLLSTTDFHLEIQKADTA
jgi:hypothetical protein